MLFKNLKTAHVLGNEELKFIKSGSAPDCEEGLELLNAEYICPENSDIGNPIGEDDNNSYGSAGCIGI